MKLTEVKLTEKRREEGQPIISGWVWGSSSASRWCDRPTLELPAAPFILRLWSFAFALARSPPRPFLDPLEAPAVLPVLVVPEPIGLLLLQKSWRELP